MPPMPSSSTGGGGVRAPSTFDKCAQPPPPLAHLCTHRSRFSRENGSHVGGLYACLLLHSSGTVSDILGLAVGLIMGFIFGVHVSFDEIGKGS